MPISVPCDDCGKVYSVSSTLAGKRAKCKACGHVFRIVTPAARAKPGSKSASGTKRPAAAQPIAPAPASKPVSKPAALPLAKSTEPSVQPPAKQLYFHDHGIISAFSTTAFITLSPQARRSAFLMRVLSWIQLRWWMLLVGLACVVVAGLGVNHWPKVVHDLLPVFPALAFAALVIGAIYTSARALWTLGDDKIPWGEMRLIVTQYVLVVFLRQRRLAFNRTVLRPDQYDRFFRNLSKLVFKSLVLAGMSGVLIGAKMVSRSLPKQDDVQRFVDSLFDDSHHHKHHSVPVDAV